MKKIRVFVNRSEHIPAAEIFLPATHEAITDACEQAGYQPDNVPFLGYQLVPAGLETYLSDLERLRELEQSGNTELHIINKQIVELTEQSHALTGLMSSGILDSALFISQTDELNRKVASLKQAKSRMLTGSKSDRLIEKTEELIAALKKGSTHLLTMDDTIFEEIVDKILASDTESLDFVLSNGLILNERL